MKNILALVFVGILFLGVEVGFCQQGQPIEILGLDFNTQDELNAYKKLLKDCPNIKFTTPLDEDQSSLGNNAYDRLLSLCKKNYSPDIVVFTGHFASAWSSGRGSLRLDDLEKLSCQPECFPFFNKVSFGFFHACNNLLGTPK